MLVGRHVCCFCASRYSAHLPLQIRSFKIGVAFVFADRVLAFLTADNVFQVCTAASRSGIRLIASQPTWMLASESFNIPPCLVTQSDLFLQNLARWLDETFIASSTGVCRLAFEVVRDAQDVWSGIGAYTAQEVFYLAGLCLGSRCS
jgi:hypothetical protein